MRFERPCRMGNVASALLIVDLQHDFLPGGALAVPRGDEILAPIAALAPRFDTVVATQDFHPPGHVSFASSHPGRHPLDVIEAHGEPQVLWPDHCVAGSPGAALAHELPDEAVTLILRKGTRRHVDSYSAFREQPGPGGVRPTTGLAGWLRERGVGRVYVAGLARDYCVRASAVDAAAEGFETLVLDDLTRAVFPERRAEVDEAFRASKVAVISSAELAAAIGEPLQRTVH
jgi:nicotinamidase/pyrazinamidase